MPYQYLLDINILSEFLKHPKGLVFYRINAAGEDQICTSIIVANELRFGADKKNSDRLNKRLEKLFSKLAILPLDRPVDRTYSEIRRFLEKAGTPIGSNDLLIAAHARALDLTMRDV